MTTPIIHAPHTMFVGPHLRQSPCSLRALAAAWEDGLSVGLWDGRINAWVGGLIIKIDLESGYSFSGRPTRFLVDLETPDGEIVRAIYVRTD